MCVAWCHSLLVFCTYAFGIEQRSWMCWLSPSVRWKKQRKLLYQSLSCAVSEWKRYLFCSPEHSPSWGADGSQLVKKFPAFYGTRMFITAFTRARHLSLSWARSIIPTSWRLISILSPNLSVDLSCGSFPSGLFSPNPRLHPSSHSYVLHSPRISLFLNVALKSYLVRSTEHKVPPYAVFSSPLLPCPS
jgi:hypothetical protein